MIDKAPTEAWAICSSCGATITHGERHRATFAGDGDNDLWHCRRCSDPHPQKLSSMDVLRDIVKNP